MKEFLLTLLAFAQELHIVDYQGIDSAELTLKAGEIAFLDSFDKSVDELLAA
ncbi:hypothetical protein ES703_124446 [subsurface metagenome]